jgi:hypothetical protein
VIASIIPPSVPCVGDQYAARPIDPAIAPGVGNLKSFSAVPHDGWLALHGNGLVAMQAFDNGKGIRRRKRRDDLAKGRIHARDGARVEIKLAGHG